jgi:hypothetical protein
VIGMRSNNEIALRPTRPAVGRGLIHLVMPCAWAVFMLTVGLVIQPAVASAAQSASATSLPHGSDPDCVSYTSPQSGAIEETCATPAGLTFAYANESPSAFEAVQFENVATQQYYQYGVQMPASGSQCTLDSAGKFTPMETSCNFSVSLPDDEYSGSATLGQVKEPFDFDVNPADQPLPALPTSSGCSGTADVDNVSGLAASYAGKGGPTNGYWKVSTNGGVSFCGGAVNYGSMSGQSLNQPVTGIVSTPDGGGYWLVAKDGGIFSFGDAQFHGSMGGTPLNQPVVSMAPTSDNNGYWLVARDGGIFAFGDAQFYGSMGGTALNKPIVGIAATPDGGGYWLVASDGGLFAFGDAQFYGSMGGQSLNKPVVGMVPSSDGGGYFLVAADGGVFAFGDAVFSGSTGSNPPSTPVVGVVVNSNGGYWIVTSGNASTASQTMSFGGAPNYG